MVLVLMLRYTMTRMRNVGLSTILPLDHHVYLHKLTGVVILVLAWTHTIMHLINFGKTHLNRDEFEPKMTVFEIRGYHGTALIKSFEMN